ncbi:MAG: cation-translocating P-type ATPase [Lachnospiraceae bacterium]|nr:cation-translocating P-type ATPase [Lachnospiraceae bacterium]
MRKSISEILNPRVPTTRYMVDPSVGLTDSQVKEYRDNGWSNRAVEPPSKSTSEIIKSNLFTYFNLIFLIIAILLVIAGSFRDLTFLPVIIANTLIGIFQEIRAKNTLEKLSVLNAPKAAVMRNGNLVTLPAEDLVLDDIVLFQAGKQICADAVVLEGEVQVNESLLTGESDEITKRPGDTLMSGSFIVSGSCKSRLTKVGEDSYISQLTLEAKAMKEGEQSEMIRSLNRLVKIVGILIIPIGILLFGQQFFISHETFRESITSMVAAVIGMIPEGLYLLASVALAVSVIRLASQKVLVHDMKCIETLARVNVLCVDKTGTITETNMKVNRVIPTENFSSGDENELSLIIGDFTAAMANDNITMQALKEYFTDHHERTAVSFTSFSSAYKYSSVSFSDVSYVLGAPEFVLREDFPAYQSEIEPYTRQGNRLLVFGTSDTVPDGKALTGKVTPLAYILLSNPIRKEAPDTFRYFSEQGVRVKVISGDNPVTVSEVAKQAGIEHADQYIDASALKSQEEIEDAIMKYTVFGRVTPDQKRQFVQALKNAGKTVAMTGDGVNDVLALKDADCSIAMASGSDAAAQAAQLVLLDNDFSKMPSVVLEGRRVVNNLQRSGSLFLVKNIFSFLLSLFSLISMVTYPLEPSQISLISMFTIGIPGFLLSLMPNRNRIEGHFISNIMVRALPAALTDFLMVATLVIFGQEFAVGSEDIATASTMLLAIVGFMILYRVSKPLNWMRWVTLIFSAFAFLFCILFLQPLFAITGMSRKCIMLLVVFSVATEPTLRYLNIFVDAVSSFWKKQKIIYHKRQKEKVGSSV